MSDKPFDPRYDPIFQRGHEGRVVPARATVGSLPATNEPVQRSTSPFSDLGLDEPVPSNRDAASTGLRPQVTTEIFGEQPEPARRRSTPNPFIVLLWVIGLGLVAFGAAVNYRFFESQFSGAMGRDDVILQQISWALSPSAVTVGLAIIAGLLFWHAASWRRARQ